MIDLYRNIKHFRIRMGLSQKELAEKLGYKSPSTIAKIECGENDITQSKILAFAKALNTTPADLMGWTEEEAQLRDVLTGKLQDTLDSLNEQDKKAVLNFADYLISQHKP